jgi:hypothetical protein
VLLSANGFFAERFARKLREVAMLSGPTVSKLRRKGSKAYADHRKSARGHIAALLELRSIASVRLTDVTDDRTLTSLLEKLSSQLQGRKRRETTKTPATNAIAFLARQLSVCFNMSAPTVLEEFDNWLELGINGTTIREIAAHEKKQWDRRVGDR